DFQHVGGLFHFFSEGGEGGGHAYNAQGGIIQHFAAGRFQNAQFVDGAVGVNRHQQAQAAVVEAAFCFTRVIACAVVFNAAAPAVHIVGIAGFHGGGGG